jgi:hypothetical protein
MRNAREVQGQTTAAHRREDGFWEAVGSALATLARRTGSSASGCPLPEVREAARDLRGLRYQQPSEPKQRLAA